MRRFRGLALLVALSTFVLSAYAVPNPDPSDLLTAPKEPTRAATSIGSIATRTR